jgi:hypothetical protein
MREPKMEPRTYGAGGRLWVSSAECFGCLIHPGDQSHCKHITTQKCCSCQVLHWLRHVTVQVLW